MQLFPHAYCGYTRAQLATGPMFGFDTSSTRVWRSPLKRMFESVKPLDLLMHGHVFIYVLSFTSDSSQQIISSLYMDMYLSTC